jgi:hypothetical protein
MTQARDGQRHLRWRVDEIAQVRGIPNVIALAALLDRPRQSLYTIWRGESKVISVDMLAALYDGLGVEPGGWFRWSETPPAGVQAPGVTGTRFLVWAIAAQIAERGLDPTDVGYAAHLVPNAFRPILLGQSRFVFLDTLGGLARALSLDLSPLFDWTTVTTTARVPTNGTALTRALAAHPTRR